MTFCPQIKHSYTGSCSESVSGNNSVIYSKRYRNMLVFISKFLLDYNNTTICYKMLYPKGKKGTLLDQNLLKIEHYRKKTIYGFSYSIFRLHKLFFLTKNCCYYDQ